MDSLLIDKGVRGRMASKKKHTRKKEQRCPSPPPISKKRLWAFRITSMILVPLVLFVCLELGLRAAGFGYSTDIAIKQKVGDRKLYCSNMKLGWRFFPKNIARKLDGFAFEVNKTPQTYRIFVLGASAARGDPDATYNFGRFLEIMLENEYPRTDFEVINAAMTAINSHAVYQIAKSCGRFEPDLMIVYLGNNEVIGPYGAGTIFAPLSPSLAMIRANAAMACTKTGQLLQRLLQAAGSGGKVPPTWGGMEMFVREQVRAEDEALKVVYGHFEQNLRDICNVGIKAGANVLISNVGCNLKDSPPFASLHRADLTDSEKRAWEEHYQEGITHETAGDLEATVASYLAAERIDDTFADLQFRLGRCYWHLGQYSKAKTRYVNAMENDALRFRADTSINHVIESVAKGRESEGVYFVDAVKALEENSPHYTPGNELFYEHVHYRSEGNYILAKTIFDQVEKTLPDTVTQHKQDSPTLTLADCQDRLVYTVFERYKSAQFVLNGLINKPPFTGQSYHDDLVTELEDEKVLLKQDVVQNLKKIQSRYTQTIHRYPQDWRLRWGLAVLYSEDPVGYEQASIQLKKVLQYLPYDRVYDALIKILIRQNKLDEAERYCREAIRMMPTFVANLYVSLGDIYNKKGEPDKAIRYFSKAIALGPAESITTYEYLAEVFEKKGNPERAIKTLYEAIANMPKDQSVMTHVHLGLLLGKQNRREEAIQVFLALIADFPPEKIEKENDVFLLLLDFNQVELAVQFYRQMLTVKPDSIGILNGLAWVEATCDTEEIRNTEEAVELAEKACVLTGYKLAGTLDTLAAAYANSGDFEKAVTTAQKAIETVNQREGEAFANDIKGRLLLYEQGFPYREKNNP